MGDLASSMVTTDRLEMHVRADGVLWQYALAYPGDLASLTMVAPLPPYGFGGTKAPAGSRALPTSRLPAGERRCSTPTGRAAGWPGRSSWPTRRTACPSRCRSRWRRIAVRLVR